VIIYAEKITPRFQYSTDFIGKLIIGKAFELTNDLLIFQNYDGPKINYSSETIPNCHLSFVNCQLLFESGINKQKIECFETNGFKALFKTTGDYAFDIFAASFYLLSRYEEYLPHKKDLYGRYAHENSLAYKQGFLNLPLINIWLDDFKKTLKQKFPQLTPDSYRDHDSRFTYLPTYDIDEAYSYRYKGVLRTVGGALRSIVSGEWSMVNERIKTLNGKTSDPFDSYEWMDALHEKYQLKPKYFFLIPSTNGKYDKNILPSHPAMQQLIQQHAEKYDTGIHPSWQSGDDDGLLKKEIETLEQISGKKISASRQHYIRFNLPNGYRRLIDAGITDDYSMGYGGINGFRASVASPFYWYDLEKEQTTNLLIHPFCYMEANSFFEQKFTPAQAFDEMTHYFNIVRSVNGTLITLWHNTFLGTDKYYAGWREVYERFLESIVSPKRSR
jgi:hypothetical protein